MNRTKSQKRSASKSISDANRDVDPRPLSDVKRVKNDDIADDPLRIDLFENAQFPEGYNADANRDVDTQSLPNVKNDNDGGPLKLDSLDGPEGRDINASLDADMQPLLDMSDTKRTKRATNDDDGPLKIDLLDSVQFPEGYKADEPKNAATDTTDIPPSLQKVLFSDADDARENATQDPVTVPYETNGNLDKHENKTTKAVTPDDVPENNAESKRDGDAKPRESADVEPKPMNASAETGDDDDDNERASKNNKYEVISRFEEPSVGRELDETSNSVQAVDDSAADGTRYANDNDDDSNATTKKITIEGDADAGSDVEDRESVESQHSAVSRSIGRTFSEFMSELKKFVNVGKSAEEMVDLTKSVKSGMNSFDDIVGKMPVRKSTNGVIAFGDATVGSVRKLVREGDISGLAKLSKSTVKITESDRKAFSALTGITPEKHIRELTENTAVAKKLYPSLDVPAKEIERLPESSKSALNKVSNNLLKKFKTGSIIALTIGTVYVGVDWLSKATEARKGCYMITTINNKTTSCKIAAHTCTGDRSSNLCTSAVPEYYNVTLVLMTISEMPNTDNLKTELCSKLNIDPKDLASSLKTIIDTKFDVVKSFVVSLNKRPTLNVCGLRSDQVENGVIPDCRMCSPSANPTSTTFIDPAQFPDNMTFQCVVNPSVLDTIMDAAASTATDLWEGVGKLINFPVKKIAIGAAIAVIVLVLLWVISKVFARSGSGSIGYNAQGTINRARPIFV